MPENRKNLAFLTWMQIIGCILVIVGHSYPFVTKIPDWALELRTFLYAFHMPLFIWCSGYLMVATNQVGKYGFGTYCRKRAVRILLPYIALSIVGFIPKFVFARYLNDVISLSWLGIIRILLVPRENVWGHFWFLPMIFLFGISGYGIVRTLSWNGNKKTCKIAELGVLLAIGCGAFFLPQLTGWFAINDIVHYFFYYIWGITCAESTRYIPAMWDGWICVAVSVLGFLMLPHSPGMQLLISVLMITAVWGISEKLVQSHIVDRKSVWAQTYSIFILAWPCQLIVEILLERITHQPFCLINLCMFAVGLLVPPLLIKFVWLIEKKSGICFLSYIIGLNSLK